MTLQAALIVGLGFLILLKWAGWISWIAFFFIALGVAGLVALALGIIAGVRGLVEAIDELIAQLRAAWREGADGLRWSRLSSRSRRVIAVTGTSAGLIVATPVLAPIITPVLAPVVAPVYHRLVLAATPVVAGFSSSSPSYSALLEPNLAPSVAGGVAVSTVRAAQDAVLKFAISPQWAANSLVKVNPGARILDGEGARDLTVTLTCDFCEPYPKSVARLTYSPKTRTSTIAEFTFRPSRAALAQPRHELVVSILNHVNAQAEDLRIPVRVVDEGRLAPDPSPMTLREVPPDPGNAPLPVDAVLFAHRSGDLVSMALVPIAPGLQRQLGPATGTPDRPTVFASETVTVADLEAIAGPAYSRIGDIVGTDTTLRQLRNVYISNESRASGQLNEKESQALTNAFGLTGRSLYEALFMKQPDRHLLEAIVQLESLADAASDREPLRLLVHTDLTLPWQYILSPARNSVGDFWGMRFALTVNQTRLPGVNARSTADDIGTAVANWVRRLFDPGDSAASSASKQEVLFAHFASERDPTVPLAREQMSMLDGFAHVTPVKSSDTMKSALEAQHDQVNAIWTFLHASAGADPSKAPPGLYFADGDLLEPSQIADLGLHGDPLVIRDRRYFGAAPLVILNACETGPSALYLPRLSLEKVMLDRGASGVVATEAPVWVRLGDSVGKELIGGLQSQLTAPVALTLTRRKIAKPPMNNPLGLLYAYYGDPGAGLNRRPAR